MGDKDKQASKEDSASRGRFRWSWSEYNAEGRICEICFMKHLTDNQVSQDREYAASNLYCGPCVAMIGKVGSRKTVDQLSRSVT